MNLENKAIKSPTLKKIFIGIIVFSIIGFIFSTELKGFYKIESFEGTSGIKEVKIDVEKSSTYTLSFWARDEEFTYEWANLECQIFIELNEIEIYNKEVIASSSDDDGVKRAQNGFEYSLSTQTSGVLKIIVNVKKGDEWSLDVYKDIPSFLNILPALFIITGIISFVGYLKVNNINNKNEK